MQYVDGVKIQSKVLCKRSSIKDSIKMLMLKILGCLWFVIPMMILIDRIKGTLALGGVSNIRVFLQHGPLGSKDSSSGKIQMTPENQAIVLVSLQSRKRNGSIFIFRQCASTPPYMTFSVLSFGLQKSWVRD